MRKYIFIFFVSSQIIIIFFLTKKIQKREGFFTERIINPIEKNSVFFNKASSLEGFYEPKPDINTDGKGIYSINPDTLNERFTYSYEKPDFTYRIIALGSSSTFGLYVRTENNYPEQLEDLLNNNMKCSNIKKYEVINLGVRGYDIQSMIERFRLRGQKYKPDLIMWFLQDYNFLQIKEYSAKKEAHYRDLYNKLPLNIRADREMPWVPAWRETINEIGRDVIVKKQKEFFENFFHIYKNPLLFISFSSLDAEFKNILQDYNVKKEDIYFHDNLVNIYKKEGTSFFDSHPTSRGYEFIAKDILNILLKEKIIPCELK